MSEPYVEKWGCEWHDCGEQYYTINFMRALANQASAECGCFCIVHQTRDCRIEYCYFPDFGFFPKCRCYAILKIKCDKNCHN